MYPKRKRIISTRTDLKRNRLRFLPCDLSLCQSVVFSWQLNVGLKHTIYLDTMENTSFQHCCVNIDGAECEIVEVFWITIAPVTAEAPIYITSRYRVHYEIEEDIIPVSPKGSITPQHPVLSTY
mmetsp:Transcript_9764/g.14546  ORF Transcript_9764/g.14546 Transcript_9764/m.14546 type:complete len:124 (-) Transcript_9764:533-904(-)